MLIRVTETVCFDMEVPDDTPPEDMDSVIAYRREEDEIDYSVEDRDWDEVQS